MKFKKSLLIIGLVICLFAMASASASDVNDTAMEAAQSDEMTASDDSNAMEQSDDEELILEDNDVDKPVLGEKASTGSFTDLNDLINNQYSSNDTITLSCNYTFNGTDDDDSDFIHGISINREVTIDGKGCTIDGSQKARIFNIRNGGTVKFLNINFINGKATGSGWEVHGGAIVAEFSNCVVECCNFTNNTADGQGGALMRVTAYNCTFTGNTAEDMGGAIHQGSAYNCVFTGNKAIGGYGGAIDSGSAYNCVFTGNRAKFGGAIYGGSAYNCTFMGNTAEGSGGAIHRGSAYNCTFTGNTAEDMGGAIRDGSAYNCIFTGNKADYGGAIYGGSAYNCTFTGNTAEVSGGAIIGDEDHPEDYNATLCMFDSNTPNDYSDIRIVNAVLSADNLTTSYKSGDRLLFNLTADNTNYTGFNTTIKIYQDGQEMGTYYALSGEGWIVDLSPGTYNAVLSLDKYEGVINGTATITVMPNNTFWALNQKINGNDKNEINLTNDYYYDLAYDSAFTWVEINRPVTINGNGYTIDAKGKTVAFHVAANNVTIKNLTIKNAFYWGDGGAIYWYGVNGSVSGCSFVNNTVNGYDGGAIYWQGVNGSVSGCSFVSNDANTGGAIYWYGVNGSVSGCSFVSNDAIVGGAISWRGVNGSVSGCSFVDNTASLFGGAIFWQSEGGSVSYSTFINNNTLEDGVVIYIWNCDLNADYNWFGNDATNYNDPLPIGEGVHCDYRLFLNATANPDTISVSDTSNIIFKLYQYHSGNITEYDNTPFKNLNLTITATNGNVSKNIAKLDEPVTYTATSWGTGSVTSSIENVKYTIETTNLGLNPDLSVDSQEADYSNSTIIAINYNSSATGTVNITLKGKNRNYTFEKELNATISLGNIDANEYEVNVIYSGDNVFFNATATGKLTINKANSTLTINDNVTFDYDTNGSTTVSFTNASGVNASVVGQPNAIVVVNDTIITVSGLNTGNYTLTVTTITDANHNNVTKNATITVNKAKTQLTGNAITTTYNIDKDLVITLKDANGNALSGFNVTVNLNAAKTYVTDANGQVKISTKGLAPKAYTAKITFNGDDNYINSNKDVKVTVKKATPKLTAKKKTFKSSVKTKKYTVTLKDNIGKAIKKAKVTLKVKGKTYKATTNSKGKATFKIKKLNKKGTFKAKITYKGSKYYNKVSKKAKIKVIVTFKTVSKGSKDKSTVKEIQQALKDHGYYLSYKGHYLKVDGKFKGCTERSVKEFQKDKHLKVTGKVDEKTAKKLGLI